MKTATLSVLLVGVLAAGFLAGAWYNQREAVSAASLGGRRILYYVDPMHPAYKSDKPGTAPDCGMQLEAVYSDGGQPAPETSASSTPGVLNIGSDRQQLVGVRVTPAETTAGSDKLHLYGRVAPDENGVRKIDAGIDGFVRDISTVTTGSRVKKDQWLATVSAPEIRTPIQGYLVALQLLDRARKDEETGAAIELANAGVQQTIDRLLTLGMSSVQIEEIGQTRQLARNIKVTAPVDGFVMSRNISAGQKVMRGEELYRTADLGRVWVLADVFGADAEYVQPGTIARISLPGRAPSFRARVSRDVLPQFDAASQSVKVRLEADNPGYLLRPDMFVDVDLLITLPPAIAVPVDAVLDSGLKKVVFVETGAGVFEPRQVETGWRFGGRVQIVTGLAAGDRVVVAGTFLLDSENRLRTTTSAGSLR